MLCSNCQGTDYSPHPTALLFDKGLDSMADEDERERCPDCGKSLLAPCPTCIGLGKKLKVMASCSSCGRSIPYWQTCSTCNGSGTIFTPSHDCQPVTQPSAAHKANKAAGSKVTGIRKPGPERAHQSHSIGPIP